MLELANPISNGGFGLTEEEAQQVITDILTKPDGGSAVILQLTPKKGPEMAKDVVDRITRHLINAGEMNGKMKGGKKRHSKRSKKQRRRKTRRSTRS